MPSEVEKNKYEIMDILVKINQAKDSIRENTFQITQITASGVITQEEDHKVEFCTRLIMYSEGLLECYKCYLPSLYTEGLSEEEKIEDPKKCICASYSCFRLFDGSHLIKFTKATVRSKL